MMPMGNTLKLEDLLKPDCVPDESAGGENWPILLGSPGRIGRIGYNCIKDPRLESFDQF